MTNYHWMTLLPTKYPHRRKIRDNENFLKLFPALQLVERYQTKTAILGLCTKNYNSCIIKLPL